MAKNQNPVMLIYPEDKEFLRESTLNYENIETGGDLFGLWKNEREVVVQLVTGPGKYCRRTPTAFFQDPTYLSNVGEYLTSAKGLCNIGEWHSHHRLNLPEPSSGDKSTVWRNMPSCGLKRFLLIIATITPHGQVNMNGFMFTAPENGAVSGGMERVETRVLIGPHPFRYLPDVSTKLDEGVEPPPDRQGPSPYISEKYDIPPSPQKPTENPRKNKQGFGQFPARVFGKHKNNPGYKPLSDQGGASGYFIRNTEESHTRDQPTSSHESSRNEHSPGPYQPAPSSSSYHTPSQKQYASYV
jgi:hypothetical protein